ncbi:hypothetical protein [Parasedimentitalea marina]|uniref:hypothetical protein n=1 Tax=Parasedimentitalea marina TaxID=2483033 RepID=UPI0013E38F99|nr:hypothetical protein [Parasedimentitalea marina]
MTKPKIPQGGGSFVRQPDGSLKQVEKPTSNPALKSAKPEIQTPKPSSKKGAK